MHAGGEGGGCSGVTKQEKERARKERQRQRKLKDTQDALQNALDIIQQLVRYEPHPLGYIGTYSVRLLSP